jgi:hypothetical protein
MQCIKGAGVGCVIATQMRRRYRDHLGAGNSDPHHGLSLSLALSNIIHKRGPGLRVGPGPFSVTFLSLYWARTGRRTPLEDS